MNKVLLVVLFLFSVSFAAEWTDYSFITTLRFDNNGLFSEPDDIGYNEFYIKREQSCLAAKSTHSVITWENCDYYLELMYSNNEQERTDSLWVPRWIVGEGSMSYRNAGNIIQGMLQDKDLTAEDSITIDSLHKEISKNWLPDYNINMDEFMEFNSLQYYAGSYSLNGTRECTMLDYLKVPRVELQAEIEMDTRLPTDSIVFLYKRKNAYYAVCKIYDYFCSVKFIHCLFNSDRWPFIGDFPTEMPLEKYLYVINGPVTIPLEKKNTYLKDENKYLYYKANGCRDASGNASGVYLGKNGGKIQLRK